MTISVILADDHHIVRKGLRGLLEEETEFRVVAETSNGMEAMEEVVRLKPDILILDLMMPGLNGLEVSRQLQKLNLPTQIIVMSMYSDESYVMEALKNGVMGYILKNTATIEIIQAIRQVIGGLRYLSPPITERAIDLYTQKAIATEIDAYDTLTNREREVLQFVVEGLGNKEIASILIISPRTVETHRANLMKKLNLQTQTDLIRFALKRGIIE